MFYLAIVLCFIFKQIVKHPTVRFFNLTEGCQYLCMVMNSKVVKLFYYLAICSITLHR